MFYVIAFCVPQLPRQQFCRCYIWICRILVYRVPIIWPVPFHSWIYFSDEGSCGTLSQVLPSQSDVLNLKGTFFQRFFLWSCSLNNVVHFDVYDVLFGEIHWGISMPFDTFFELYYPSLNEKMSNTRFKHSAVTQTYTHTYINKLNNKPHWMVQ